MCEHTIIILVYINKKHRYPVSSDVESVGILWCILLNSGIRLLDLLGLVWRLGKLF